MSSSDTPTKPKPNPDTAAKYHEAAEKVESLKKKVVDLRSQSEADKAKGGKGFGEKITELKKEMVEWVNKEQRLRKLANEEVRAKGGTVDSGHEYAASHNMHNPNPVTQGLHKGAKKPEKTVFKDVRDYRRAIGDAREDKSREPQYHGAKHIKQDQREKKMAGKRRETEPDLEDKIREWRGNGRGTN